MKYILTILLFIFFPFSVCQACDFSNPDKAKHIEYSKNFTRKSCKAFSIPFLPLKPVKWLFNPYIQKAFPDNYLPEAMAAAFVFTATTLKEATYDLVVPGRHASYCDVMANCRGIKQGIREENNYAD